VLFRSVRERLEGLRRQGRRAKLIYTIVNFQNPAGMCQSLRRRHELIALAHEYETLILEDDAYHMDVALAVENRNPDLRRTLNLLFEGPCGIADPKRAAFTTGPTGVLYTVNEERGGRDFELANLAPGELVKAPYSWSPGADRRMVFAGVASNYFALLMEPKEGDWIRQVRFLPLEVSEKVPQAALPPDRLEAMRREARENVKTDFLLALAAPAPGETREQRFLFFAGPKSTDLMQQPEYDEFYALIEHDYGATMKWINVALVWILKLFHSILGNWGLAIICLTFVVKGLLFPLNRMQQVSMHNYSEKMKKLKPKLDEIRKKYKNNKKKFNEAQMRIMKEEGIRPPMGCLLIFLQFPIFIGLFQVLRTSFELRHSPFFLWINDLSQPDALAPLPFTIPLLGWDTLNVLPLLMTIAFYYQQKMMPQPTTGDPQAEQMQKMMRFMPVFFGFLLYNYAAGLSLYWMTSNLISIFEYKVIRKRCLQSIQQDITFQHRVAVKVSDHSFGMNSRVSPPGAGHRQRLCYPHQPRQPEFQFSLHGAQTRLLLPAVESAAVICNVQSITQRFTRPKPGCKHLCSTSTRQSTRPPMRPATGNPEGPIEGLSPTPEFDRDRIPWSPTRVRGVRNGVLRRQTPEQSGTTMP